MLIIFDALPFGTKFVGITIESAPDQNLLTYNISATETTENLGESY